MALNFPFWGSLSEKAQITLRIAQRMKDTGETFGRASWHLTGKAWDAAKFQNGLTSVTSNMSELGVSSVEVDALVAEATAAAEATAVGGGLMGLLTTIGEWLGLSGGTAAVAGGLVVTAVLGGVTYGVSNYLGSISGDKPILAGTRMSKPKAAGVEATSQGAGPYYIYVLDIEPGGSVYVGGKTDVQTPSCHFTDGGTCHDGDQNVKVLATLGGTYDGYGEAVAAYCKLRTETHSAYGGTKGTVDGKLYWLDNAPSC
jgi:hypothetical protein